MTKKRFEFKLCSNGLNYLWENNELYISNNGDYIILENSSDVIELLNEFANENEKLKQTINDIEIILSEDIGYIEAFKRIEKLIE